MTTPVPFDESKCKDKFWNKDIFDKFIPKRKGFITDCIYTFRGTEVPTIYTIWSSLVALSMVVKREAWVEFGFLKRFANLYIILIGKAGLAKKTFVIDELSEIIEESEDYITDPIFKKIKRFVTVSDQITPEGLIDSIVRGRAALGTKFNVIIKNKQVYEKTNEVDKEGKPIKIPLEYDRPNEQLILAEELGVLLGKQSYNEGMTILLTSLYSNRRKKEKTTKADNTVYMKNLYTSFLAGITPKGFRDSIPKSAREDGFLTRTILINSPNSGRRSSKPRIIEGAPTKTDLAKRLAWIAQNVTGEYKMTATADAWYDKWYNKHKDKLEDGDEWSEINSRMDVHLLKVALLLRANLYEGGFEITLDDLKEADTLLKATAQYSKLLIKEIDGGEWGDWLLKVDQYLKVNVHVKRRDLLRAYTGRLDAFKIDEILDRLHQEDKIKIVRGTNKDCKATSKDGSETYNYQFEEEG